MTVEGTIYSVTFFVEKGKEPLIVSQTVNGRPYSPRTDSGIKEGVELFRDEVYEKIERMRDIIDGDFALERNCRLKREFLN